MAKIQIKSEKITPFGGIFPIMDAFDRVLGGIVDSTLGFRCKLFGHDTSRDRRTDRRQYRLHFLLLVVGQLQQGDEDALVYYFSGVRMQA